MTEKLYRPRELAAALGISRSHVYYLYWSDRLKGIWIIGNLRIQGSEFERMVREYRHGERESQRKRNAIATQ